jgi:hypothetical protein
MVFVRFFGSKFPICLTILHMFIPIVFYSRFPTHGFHSHSIEIRCTIGGPIGRSVVCSSPLLCFSLYNNSPPYLCFPFFSKWYTYSKSRIRCDSYVFTIATRVINIIVLSEAHEVCRLVSLKVGPLCITSSWLSYFQFEFSYFGRTNGIHIIC